MTRGPIPKRTFADICAIATKRGTLTWFDLSARDSALFAIFTFDLVSIVGVRRTKRLRACPEEILREFAGTIAELKSAVLTGQVIRELWLCSYNGGWRFFQLVGGDLAELDRDGRPVGRPCIAPSKTWS